MNGGATHARVGLWQRKKKGGQFRPHSCFTNEGAGRRMKRITLTILDPIVVGQPSQLAIASEGFGASNPRSAPGEVMGWLLTATQHVLNNPEQFVPLLFSPDSIAE